MKNDQNTGTRLPAVRTMEVINVDALKDTTLGSTIDIYAYDMYEVVKPEVESNGVVEPAVLKLSAGNKRNVQDIMVLDVTGEDDEFKEKYSRIIQKMEVSKIIGEHPKKQNNPGMRIINLLPLDGVYGDLNASAYAELGKDYVNVESTDQGLRVVNVIVARRIPQNMYLRVYPENFSDTLREMVSKEVVELAQLENGFYKQVDDSPEKQLRLKEVQQ